MIDFIYHPMRKISYSFWLKSYVINLYIMVYVLEQQFQLTYNLSNMIYVTMAQCVIQIWPTSDSKITQELHVHTVHVFKICRKK